MSTFSSQSAVKFARMTSESRGVFGHTGHVCREMAAPNERTPLLRSPDDSNVGSRTSTPGPWRSRNIVLCLDDTSASSESRTSRRFMRLPRSLSQAPHERDDGNGDQGSGDQSSGDGVALDPSVTQSRRTLNTFLGVFCPVALSMFSTLLYLRGGMPVTRKWV